VANEERDIIGPNRQPYIKQVDKGGLYMKIPIRTMTLAALFAVLTAVGAFIRIPFPLVPMTLQTLFVYLSGTLLGSRGGALSQVLYVGMGLVGLPVFTGGGGPQFVLHPTFGFLVGFIAGSFVIGYVLERVKKVSFLTCFAACAIGTAVIYFAGTVGLYLNLNFVAGKAVSFGKVLEIGVLPFVAVDAIKAAAVAAVTARVAPRLRHAMTGK
jgi:biotin transport system substrate-specific component